jgi:hypothetical protein
MYIINIYVHGLELKAIKLSIDDPLFLAYTTFLKLNTTSR